MGKLGGREVVLCLAGKGEREGIQKGRRDSREERPPIYAPKRRTTSKIQNRQDNVCNFNNTILS
jgi:hypothetical protein